MFHGDMQQRTSQTISFAEFLAPAMDGSAPAKQQLYLAQVLSARRIVGISMDCAFSLACAQQHA